MGEKEKKHKRKKEGETPENGDPVSGEKRKDGSKDKKKKRSKDDKKKKEGKKRFSFFGKKKPPSSTPEKEKPPRPSGSHPQVDAPAPPKDKKKKAKRKHRSATPEKNNNTNDGVTPPPRPASSANPTPATKTPVASRPRNAPPLDSYPSIPDFKLPSSNSKSVNESKPRSSKKVVVPQAKSQPRSAEKVQSQPKQPSIKKSSQEEAKSQQKSADKVLLQRPKRRSSAEKLQPSSPAVKSGSQASGKVPVPPKEKKKKRRRKHKSSTPENNNNVGAVPPTPRQNASIKPKPVAQSADFVDFQSILSDDAPGLKSPSSNSKSANEKKSKLSKKVTYPSEPKSQPKSSEKISSKLPQQRSSKKHAPPREEVKSQKSAEKVLLQPPPKHRRSAEKVQQPSSALTPSSQNFPINVDEVLRIGSVLERYGIDEQRRKAFEWLAEHRSEALKDSPQVAHNLMVAVGDLVLTQSLVTKVLHCLLQQGAINKQEYVKHFAPLERSTIHLTIAQLSHLLSAYGSHYQSASESPALS